MLREVDREVAFIARVKEVLDPTTITIVRGNGIFECLVIPSFCATPVEGDTVIVGILHESTEFYVKAIMEVLPVVVPEEILYRLLTTYIDDGATPQTTRARLGDMNLDAESIDWEIQSEFNALFDHFTPLIIDENRAILFFVSSDAVQTDLWMYRTDDGGATWPLTNLFSNSPQYIRTNGGRFISPFKPNGVAVERDNPDNCYFIINYGPRMGLYGSTDGGETWAQLSSTGFAQGGFSNSPKGPWALLIDQDNPLNMWTLHEPQANGAQGNPGWWISYSQDGGATWTASTGLQGSNGFSEFADDSGTSSFANLGDIESDAESGSSSISKILAASPHIVGGGSLVALAINSPFTEFIEDGALSFRDSPQDCFIDHIDGSLWIGYSGSIGAWKIDHSTDDGASWHSHDPADPGTTVGNSIPNMVLSPKLGNDDTAIGKFLTACSTRGVGVQAVKIGSYHRASDTVQYVNAGHDDFAGRFFQGLELFETIL